MVRLAGASRFSFAAAPPLSPSVRLLRFVLRLRRGEKQKNALPVLFLVGAVSAWAMAYQEECHGDGRLDTSKPLTGLRYAAAERRSPGRSWRTREAKESKEAQSSQARAANGTTANVLGSNYFMP